MVIFSINDKMVVHTVFWATICRAQRETSGKRRNASPVSPWSSRSWCLRARRSRTFGTRLAARRPTRTKNVCKKRSRTGRRVFFTAPTPAAVSWPRSWSLSIRMTWYRMTFFSWTLVTRCFSGLVMERIRKNGKSPSTSLRYIVSLLFYWIKNQKEKLSFSQLKNQSINQSTNQPIDQTINQSNDRSIDQSINQTINQSIDQSINQPID